MSLAVRHAESSDLSLLPDIEGAADLLFASLGIVFPPGPSVIEEAIRDGARVYVAGNPPVGFAAVRERTGGTHLEQLAVHPDYGRRGIGTSLMGQVTAHAVATGSPRVTLITFCEVPWHAPWYTWFGFTELPEAAYCSEIRSLWQAEIAAGLHRLGPRVVMSSHRSPAV